MEKNIKNKTKEKIKEKFKEKDCKNNKKNNKGKKKNKNKVLDKKNLKDEKSIQTLDDKLKYIGLDIETVPDFLGKQAKTRFVLDSLAKAKSEKVYIYLNIKNLDFLIGYKNPEEELGARYKEAESISNFLKFNSKNDDEAKRTLDFLKVVESADINELKRIEKMQELLKEIPFSIRYFKSHMWNIYYSRNAKKYFMLVSLEDLDHNEFIFALKKKIESLKNNKDYYIFVPINHIEQSDKFLNFDEKNEFENILWYFTRNWPISYDVYNKENEYILNFIGDINISESIKARYLSSIKTKKEAIELYKFLKAMYTLEYETKKYIKFEAAIDEDASLIFKYLDREIKYESLPKIFKEIYEDIAKKYNWLSERLEEREVESYVLKNKMKEKEDKYKSYQNEIVKYLNIKDTFFGRFKYFFKKNFSSRVFKNSLKKYEYDLEDVKASTKEEIKEKMKREILNLYEKNNINIKFGKIEKFKENITVEDIINIYKAYDILNERIIKYTNDINEAKIYLINIDKKIRNAVKYLEEIEFSKRSIFSFWKFTNKDNINALNEGDKANIKKENESKDLELKEKIFNFKMEYEKFFEDADQKMRNILNEKEISNIYVSYIILKEINLIKKLENIKETKDKNNEEEIKIKEELEKSLKKLKDEFKNSKNYAGEKYNIFGQTGKTLAVRYMKDKSFREKDRNIFEILDIHESTNLDEYINILKNLLKLFEESIDKIKTNQRMTIYRLEEIGDEEKNKTEERYLRFNLNVEEELKNYKGTNKKLRLIQLNITKDINIIYLSNIIFYQNTNNTLPLGMEKGGNIIIDSQNLKNKKETKIINLNKYFDKISNIDKEVPYNLYDKIVSENNIKEIHIDKYITD